MDILPAIDLRDGKVVRLSQGDYDAQTTYSDNPADVAREFALAGARWIHVVDLDAARSGELTNTDQIRRICDAVRPHVRVQCGGGLRHLDAIGRLRDAGVSRMVIGSAALKNWPWFESLLHAESFDNACLALGLDARDGAVATEGWTEQLTDRATDIAARVKGSGLGAIVYTDIARDGMLSGVNIDATERIIQATDVPVIASGGVAGLEDILSCKHIHCSAVIVGKAYYEKRLTLKEAIRLAS
jgi:phosphoribosylformimino-5-aminoimidazole carboxamide ribotide isomerase